jgi:hypothetical protein
MNLMLPTTSFTAYCFDCFQIAMAGTDLASGITARFPQIWAFMLLSY